MNHNSLLFRRKSVAQLQKDSETSSLKRTLTAFDLTMLGIGAIIGTGIFVLTGEAAAGTPDALGAGPAITISFVITGLACGFAALCYAEFASMIPISGSAYTYAYASFGEIIAWIIGWDLILEYAIGNVAVAIGWSGYFKSFLSGLGVHFPPYLMASTGTELVQLSNGEWQPLTDTLKSQLGSQVNMMPHEVSILNFPALIITFVVTVLLIIGIKESARTNSVLVIIKLLLVGLFLYFGIPHFNPSEHWQNFAPNGWHGIMTGAALVFFAYIGFDAVSTTAEETKNPQRNLPIGMIAALIVCTILYIAVAAVLTGMVPLDVLANEKPISAALDAVGENKVAFIISLGITLTMPTVLLVMQMGQIRIFYSMSRDGLLPKKFSRVSKRFRTPAYSTIVVGLLVGLLAGFMDIGAVAELTNIGTLFAFVLVAIGVWILRVQQPDRVRKFKVPAYKL
ncbi:amino acid permease, partial [Gelidibacter sp.]|uniref:amino acid permease n=1 Tax=Gelidibacter sp. TaxID=2018083 RepID=UPI0032632D26